ncbi:MAG: glycoside hydrolase family 88 protein [Propionibacteriaceae bacterium]|nr:glycoside hydrolase family 88 protein [Propionibacteriaceae bacterium]
MGSLKDRPSLDWQMAADRAAQQVAVNAALFGENYPGHCTDDGIYRLRPALGVFPDGANQGWTTGFVPGAQWAAWELTGAESLRDAALGHVASFARRADERIDTQTHDLGFLYTLSCVTAWQLAGDQRARSAALRAADLLLERVLEPAGIVQAWGAPDDPAQRGRTIIDSLMNMPLLFWAADAAGQPGLAATAERHVRQLRDHIIRPDGSTFHTYYWDIATGAALRASTQQGLSDDSCWARGQAWGILGFAINYRHCADASLLDAASRCADYYLAHLPDDGVPMWDLAFGESDDQPRDSSAAAIAACGLLELAGHLDMTGSGAAAGAYRQAAEAACASLVSGYVPDSVESGRPLLLHGVYDMPMGNGIDEGNLWGDYFYLEALLRLTNTQWAPWW